MNFKHFFVWGLLILSFIGCGSQDRYVSSLKWTAINVSTPKPQGDAHVIVKNNKVIIVDGGEYNQGKKHLLPFLKKHKYFFLDALLITHPHFDHYGGIIAILEDKTFKVKELYMNMPTKQQMKREWWGGKYRDLLYIQKLAKKRGVKVLPIEAGKVFWFSEDSYLKVLYVYDGIDTPVGKTDLNDMSAIIMIYDYDHRFLLTGDLNNKLGKYLAKNAKDLQADILKVPHHGAEGLAPNSFFDRVGAKYFIVTAPSYFWQDKKWKRSDRVKKYAQDNNITTFITGVHGDITVISNKEKFFFMIEPTRDSKQKKEDTKGYNFIYGI